MVDMGDDGDVAKLHGGNGLYWRRTFGRRETPDTILLNSEVTEMRRCAVP
jgi:hypothetical protein